MRAFLGDVEAVRGNTGRHGGLGGSRPACCSFDCSKPSSPGRLRPPRSVYRGEPIVDEEHLPVPPPPGGQILIYRDGAANLQVRLDSQTVWLTQAAIAELYQTTKQNISLHIQNILEEKELQHGAVVKEYLTTAADGKRYRTLHYSLDMILAVGYRVRSARGTAFRQWATVRLGELLVKGFTLDDERIKAGRTLGRDYFDELLARIRDIRSSERLFYQKITDIYSTSIDYDANAEMTRQFFQIVQDKMHWAAHGHTAAAEGAAARWSGEKLEMDAECVRLAETIDRVCLCVAIVLPVLVVLRWNLYGVILGTLIHWTRSRRERHNSIQRSPPCPDTRL
jgi:hypothetical protein